MSSIYLSNAIFMMIILTIIFLRIRYYITWSQSKKYTMIFIGMVELYVLMDALFMKELLGKSGNLLQFKLVVFFFYLVYVIMPGVSVPTVLPGNRSTALLPVHGGAPARSDGV